MSPSREWLAEQLAWAKEAWERMMEDEEHGPEFVTESLVDEIARLQREIAQRYGRLAQLVIDVSMPPLPQPETERLTENGNDAAIARLRAALQDAVDILDAMNLHMDNFTSIIRSMHDFGKSWISPPQPEAER